MNVLRFVLLGLFGGIVNAGMGYDGRFFNGVAIGLLIAAVWRLSERLNRLERRADALDKAEAQPSPRVARGQLEEGSAHAVTAPAPATIAPASTAPSVTSPAAAAPDEELFALELPPEMQVRTGELPRPAPREPQPFNRPEEVSVFEAKLRALIFGGNPVVRAGLVVLFFGVAFLFKFAAEHQLVPVELRYLGVVAGAIALLTIGWRQRSARPGFALLAQGGAVGVLYITVFAAMRLHDLVPAPLAFALLVALVMLSGLLAVLQDARGLAVAGAMGGFLAPILVSTGAGNHVALFSYYTLLNAGVLGIAWYRSWRVLNLVGFVFTFGIGALWGFYSYRQDLFWSTEPFLILFFVMYVALSVFRATRRPPELRGYVDGTLVFGLPAIAFGLQAGLVRGMEFALAWSAFGMALIYLALAFALWRRAGEGLRLLVEAFLALGVVFGSLAIPLAVEGRWTAAAWALEGAALVWIGVRQGRLGARVFGLLLQLGAGVFFLEGWRYSYLADLAVFNARFLGGACIAIGGLLSAWHLRTKERLREGEAGLEPLLLGWGLLWWFGTIFHEAHDHLGYADRLHGYVALTALTAIAMSETARRTAWRTLALPLSATGFALLLLLFPDLGESHPFARFGFVAWGLALAALYGVLRRQENVLPRKALEWQHQTGLWMAALLLGAESSWALAELSEGGDAWRLAAWGIALLALMLLAIRLSARISWPLAAWRNAYASLGPLPIVALVAAGCAASALWADGDPAPLSYLPLINPLELSQLFVLLALLRWRMLRVAPAAIAGRFVDGAMGLVAFAVLNGVLARSVHFYAGVPFEWDPLLHSTELQTAFAVVWTLLALALTVTAARLGRRSLWVTGAALLVVVVAKLFLVDLVHSNTIERIISFLGVGALMLAIGFFAPLPPAAPEKEA